MSRTWRITVGVIAALGIASTPVVWLLDGPGAGQFIGATVQAGTGIAAAFWTWRQGRSGPDPVTATPLSDTAIDTGEAKATSGGSARTGVRRPRAAGDGTARAVRTGDATADGRGSSASTGIDYS
ncbi:hypothetical protein OG493_09330 [Streptomyces sp. NBC_01285]|nr:hypothetical protein [Streptomyces sp. ADI92-24]MCX4769882.1 hypothetical protein [Streptomyces sp. NBC_01285]